MICTNIIDITVFSADKGNGDEIDLCGHSCQSVISMSAPCTTTWEMGCGAIDPPEGFTSQSTLYDLCPNECPGSFIHHIRNILQYLRSSFLFECN